MNPERYYRSFRRNVEVKDAISDRRSFSAVRRIEERLESLDKASLGAGEHLALYRAFHTAGMELVEGVLLALEAECRAFHLDYPADQALEQLAWLAVAGRRFTCYVEVASRLGTDHWREVEALATSALRSKRHDLAVEVFQAADRPGRHQQRLRELCTALTGVVIGDPDGSRPSLKILRGSTSGSAQR